MTKPHRLTPLLQPRSVAYIGASNKPASPGNVVITMAKRLAFDGAIYPINPNYQDIEQLPCYASVHELPEPPDLAVISVADTRVEAVFEDAIRAGVKSALIFGGANLDERESPKLPQRLQALAKEANIPLCGVNCMGFYNLDHNLLATFHNPPHVPLHGHCTLITHSGSSWSSLTHNDSRLSFNLSISTGQEANVSVADYMDFALDQPTTRVIGLVLETIRDPHGFVESLHKANSMGIPVVALKVGRTEASARLAVSHSGAIAGDDGVYEAVFDRYGVSRVDTLEELGAAFSLLSRYPDIGPGQLVSTHDSGFERELFVDLADAYNVPLVSLQDETAERLSELLDPGLEPINPLDVWGTGYDYERVFTETFSTLLRDKNAAIGIVAHSARDGAAISDAWLNTSIDSHRQTGVPVVFVTNFPWTRHAGLLAGAVAADIPMVEGMPNGLVGVRCLFEQRDFKHRAALQSVVPADNTIIEKWRARLASPEAVDEVQVLELLEDFGIHTTRAKTFDNIDDVLAASTGHRHGSVLKTANPDIQHKTEVGGVKLALRDEAALREAFDDLTSRLGPQVSLAPMYREGVEMSLGVVMDAQFGPMVMIGAGGTLIELLKDRRLSLATLDEATALRLISTLKSSVLLRGHRASAPVDINAFAKAAVRLGVLAAALGEFISALDVNPLLVTSDGAVALDGLLVKR